MSPGAPLAGERCVVIGGAGAVGALFVDRLLSSGAEVCVVDAAPLPGGPAHERLRVLAADITTVAPRLVAELARADLVLLALPEPVALAVVKPVAAALRPTALLVDTLSVKGQIVAAVRAQAPGVQAVSLNPMFAPALGFAGRPVAAVVVHDGPRARALVRLVETWGGRVVRVSAEQHDRLTCATQALTHAAVLAFGVALGELDVDIAELAAIAPPPHATMLALLARIASGTPEVYWDVQAGNPQAPLARTALAAGVRRFAGLVERGDEAEFAAFLGRLRGLLGPDLAGYRDLCAQLFEAMPAVDSHGGPHDPSDTRRTPGGQLGGIAYQQDL